MYIIPKNILSPAKKLKKHKFEVFLVGGCVRDLLLKKTPKDWDLTTNATPKEILKIFPDSFYDNNFGTVGIKNRENNSIIEITTYRTEKDYKDFRHPQSVQFTQKITDDLKRRDFTINAIALDPFTQNLIDPFLGQKDLTQKTIRCVDNPQKRFQEDALRLLRAVRFSVRLNFSIEPSTLSALIQSAPLLTHVSKERIRDEFTKIMLSDNPAYGIELLNKTQLLKYFLPELINTIDITQNLHHKRTVFNHLVFTLKNCPSPKLSVRLASLFHDLGKPQVKRKINKKITFYNHEIASMNLTKNLLNRLRFNKSLIQKVCLLIKNHMFYYEVDKVTPTSVRKLLHKVGKENIDDLIQLRIADRLGSDCPKAKPYKLRHLEYLIEKVSKDPISVKMLKINGDDLHRLAQVEKGPKMGAILDILLAKVLEDPKKNQKTILIKIAKQLNLLDFTTLREQAKTIIQHKQQQEDQKLKTQFYLK